MTWLRANAPILLAFCVLAAILTYPQAAAFTTSVADHPDPLFSIWRLGWVAHQIAADPRHLFDANIFYPEPSTFAFSDAMLLPGVLLAPLFWIRLPPVAIYNGALLGALALSGFMMFLLARELTGDATAAFAAGMIYAFAPYRFEQYIHLEMEMVFWIPLALVFLHRVVAGRRLRDGVALGLTLAAQILSGMYGAMYFFVSLAVLVPALLLATGVRKPAGLFVSLVAGGLLCALLVLPYAVVYSRAARLAGPRTVAEIQHYGASLASYVAAPAGNRLLGWTARFGGEELNLLPGITAIVLGAIGAAVAFTHRRRVPLAYLALLVFALDASRGFDGFVYPLLYRSLPPIQGLRVPSRFALIVNLALGVLAAVGLAHLLTRVRRTRFALAGAVVLAMTIEYASAPALARVPRPSLPDRWLLSQPRGVLVELPLPTPDTMWPNKESLFMYEGMTHWLPMVNGYSGFFPPSYLQLVDVMESFPDDDAIDYLRRRGVQYVLIRENFYDQNRWKDLKGRLAHARGLSLLAGFPSPGNELLYSVNR